MWKKLGFPHEQNLSHAILLTLKRQINYSTVKIDSRVCSYNWVGLTLSLMVNLCMPYVLHRKKLRSSSKFVADFLGFNSHCKLGNAIQYQQEFFPLLRAAKKAARDRSAMTVWLFVFCKSLKPTSHLHSLLVNKGKFCQAPTPNSTSVSTDIFNR